MICTLYCFIFHCKLQLFLLYCCIPGAAYVHSNGFGISFFVIIHSKWVPPKVGVLFFWRGGGVVPRPVGHPRLRGPKVRVQLAGAAAKQGRSGATLLQPLRALTISKVKVTCPGRGREVFLEGTPRCIYTRPRLGRAPVRVRDSSLLHLSDTSP